MSTAANLYKALKAKRYDEANEHFVDVIRKKMRATLVREYRDVAKTFLKPTPKKSK